MYVHACVKLETPNQIFSKYFWQSRSPLKKILLMYFLSLLKLVLILLIAIKKHQQITIYQTNILRRFAILSFMIIECFQCVLAGSAISPGRLPGSYWSPDSRSHLQGFSRIVFIQESFKNPISEKKTWRGRSVLISPVEMSLFG